MNFKNKITIRVDDNTLEFFSGGVLLRTIQFNGNRIIHDGIQVNTPYDCHFIDILKDYD